MAGISIWLLSALLIMEILPSAALGQVLQEVEFRDYTPRSALQEIVRRLSSPLGAARLRRTAAERGQSLAGQTINLSEERFIVYLPKTHPEHGFGVLVFVPPWQMARIPLGWERVLDGLGIIFVSTARSGNEENVIGRRVPLALLATYNVMRRYDIDTEHVYVAGFSGGSRVMAMRLALAYPDVFRGALLNAGSDPIGEPQVPLPPGDLLYEFQQSSRVVFVTGAKDPNHAAEDQASARSMKRWCVTNLESAQPPLLWTRSAAAAVGSVGAASPVPDARRPARYAKYCGVPRSRGLRTLAMRALRAQTPKSGR